MDPAETFRLFWNAAIYSTMNFIGIFVSILAVLAIATGIALFYAIVITIEAYHLQTKETENGNKKTTTGLK